MESGLPLEEWLDMWRRHPRWPSDVTDKIESLSSLLADLTPRMWIQVQPEDYSWTASFYYPDQQLYTLKGRLVSDQPDGLRLEIDRNQKVPYGPALGSDSSFVRSLLWTKAIIQPMEGHLYQDKLKDIDKRLALYKSLRKAKDRTIKKIDKSFRQMFGRPTDLPAQVEVAIADWFIKPGKIAAYTPPVWNPKGKVTIAHRAFPDWDYINDILLHELIHGAFGNEGCMGQQCQPGVHQDSHHADFKRLATALGLPEQYQD